MSRRDTIDSMTAGETILLAANNAALSVPEGENHFALMALVSVTRWVTERICQPKYKDMVMATFAISDMAWESAEKSSDKYEYAVYTAVAEAAQDFSQALDYNLSMEAESLPF